MAKFSANLGFLWQELSLCDGIAAAADAGFAAVECHWPYAVAPAHVRAAMAASKLPMLGLNTRRGDVDAGDFGVAAVAGREHDARAFIDEAVDYAAEIDCASVHVMAGRTGATLASERVYRENLTYACERAAAHGITILIEPINHRDVPDYHLSHVEAGVATIDAVACDNLKLMFDCYHTQIMQGDLSMRLQEHLGYIGHVQIAAVPDRGEPGVGELDFFGLMQTLDGLGYAGFVGAEYKPRTTTDAGLGWLKPLLT